MNPDTDAEVIYLAINPESAADRREWLLRQALKLFSRRGKTADITPTAKMPGTISPQLLPRFLCKKWLVRHSYSKMSAS